MPVSPTRVLRRPPQPRSLHRVCFRHPSRPHTGGQVFYRSDTIVVLVRRCCYGGHGSSCSCLALFGHISSSKAGFVRCFERREQFRRSCVFSVATYRNDLISVGGHKKNLDLQKTSWTISVFFASVARFPQKQPTEICSFLYFSSPIAVGLIFRNILWRSEVA